METLRLHGENEKDIALAAEILSSGGLCAIPTETVYGLAANAYNGEAVAKIFKAKGRPQDNPLIVHIDSLDRLSELWTEVPRRALRLAEAFWPGPLTMVMYKSDLIPEEVSCGLQTVGVRFPEHPVARRVIERAKVPLAAPSANLSGKPSPTTAAHVLEDMSGKIEAVLDGGDCLVGVESTVVDITGEVPRVLRPGAITEEMIADVLGSAFTDPAVEGGLQNGEKPRSPGMKYRHYAPASPVKLLCGSPEDTEHALAEAPLGSALICFTETAFGKNRKIDPARFSKIVTVGESRDHAMHARKIFAALRAADDAGEIYIQCPRKVGAGAGTVNRLMRAAGFNFTQCTPYPVIGLTGRSGSGKSYLSKLLGEKLNLPVFDSDAVYKQLLSSGGDMAKAVIKAFPEAEENGSINRRTLGGIVFKDKEKKALLESITHPYVAREAKKLISESRGCILDVPLLFESGMDRLCTATVGVVADESLIAERIKERDSLTDEAAQLRLKSQPDAGYYRANCDIIVKNNGCGFENLETLASKLTKI